MQRGRDVDVDVRSEDEVGGESLEAVFSACLP